MKKSSFFLKAAVLLLILCCSMVFLPAPAKEQNNSFVEGDASRLYLEKNVFTEGEPIMVSATGTGSDWVGLFLPDESHSVRYFYLDRSHDLSVGSGVLTDMRHSPGYSRIDFVKYILVPAGEYYIRLLPNDSNDLSDQIAWAKITVLPGEPEKEGINGDSSRLHLEKFVFTEGEPIMVSATGTGSDWVGLFLPDRCSSVRYYYLNPYHPLSVGSGVLTDMRKSPGYSKVDYVEYVEIPAGEYYRRLMPNDSNDLAEQIAWAKITVLPAKPVSPLSVDYKIKDTSKGFAEGRITVKVPKEKIGLMHILLYWGDENGILEDYNVIASLKASDETTFLNLPSGMIIPQGTTKLLAYGSSLDGSLISEKCAEYILPKGADINIDSEPLLKFSAVSDVHIKKDLNDENCIHFTNFLKDTVEITPDSDGIFIVGDMANSGNEQEYKNLYKLHGSVEGAPDLYLAVGNHDLYHRSTQVQTKLFAKYATLPDGTHPKSSHYDFWMNGYHFIILGNDKMVDNLYTTLSEETLKWLDETLAENYDPSRPAFIFLHQSLYNTVSGSLKGQHWNGVLQECEAGFRAVLKKYPEAIMFNGHSHWPLDSKAEMFVSDGSLPNIFNTGSTAYLANEIILYIKGSQGLYVYVYKDKVIVKGRDFLNNKWIPKAQFCVYYDRQIKIGDINRDEKITSLDYSMLKRSVLGTYETDGAQHFAGDINRDGKIAAIDYTMLKRMVLGTYKQN